MEEQRYEELKWTDDPLCAANDESNSSPNNNETEHQPQTPLVSTETTEKQRYEELKWTEAPLCYNNDEDSSSLFNNKEQHAESIKRPRMPINGETTALLCVDVQPEYWSKSAAVRNDFPEFPSRFQATVDTCRQRRAKIIWVRADYRYAHSPWLVQFERLRGKNPDFMMEVPCDPQSEEFSWEPFATPQGGEAIITKRSWSSTSETALRELLRVNGIDTVLVCGLITSVCVQHSAFGLFESGYRTILVTDACADRGRARHEAALALYGDYMYELVTSKDLEDPKAGLVPAKPVWLTLNNNIRPSRDVSPMSSFGDLQHALYSIEKSGTRNESAVEDTEVPAAVAPSMVSTSECTGSS